MNRFVIVGNGFDLAHGLPTRYEDFLLSYFEKAIKISRENALDAIFKDQYEPYSDRLISVFCNHAAETKYENLSTIIIFAFLANVSGLPLVTLVSNLEPMLITKSEFWIVKFPLLEP